MHGEKQLMDN